MQLAELEVFWFCFVLLVGEGEFKGEIGNRKNSSRKWGKG